MEILDFKKGPIYILGVQGKLDAVNAPRLREKLFSLIDADENIVLLDCSGLEYISSAGLRVLYEAGYKLAERSGKMALCSIGGHVKRVIDLVDMSAEFPIYPSREEACTDLAQ